jgi:hypothetical protein
MDREDQARVPRRVLRARRRFPLRQRNVDLVQALLKGRDILREA